MSQLNFREERIKEFQEAFEIFDKDKDGYINSKELGNVMRSLGHDPVESDLEEILLEVDRNKDGLINFEEFASLMNRKFKGIDIEEELIEAFRVFDKEGNGYVSCEDLTNILMTLGENLSEEEISEMISDADYNGEGNINYQEFVRLMLNIKY